MTRRKDEERKQSPLRQSHTTTALLLSAIGMSTSAMNRSMRLSAASSSSASRNGTSMP